MMIDDSGLTKPDAGVIATNPATAPDAAPSIVGLPVFTHSATIQPRAANDAAVCVATNALVAKPPALSAEPALNPNQPTTWRRQSPQKAGYAAARALFQILRVCR